MKQTAPQAHQVLKLDLERTARAMLVLMRANVPGAIWGTPGFAKTALAHVATEVARRIMYEVHLAYYEETDLAGLPHPTKDRTVGFLRPRFMPYKCGDPEQDARRVVLLFDEYDRATDRMQNCTLQLLREHRLGEHELVDDCRILITGNAATDVFTTQLSEAAATRITHIYLDATSERTRDYWLSEYAEPHDLAPAVRTYAKECWDEIAEHHDADDYAQPVKPNLRTLEMASDLIKAADDLTEKSGQDFSSLIVPLLAGTISTGPAVKIYGIHAAHIDAHEIDRIFHNPETAPITDNGRNWLISNAILHRVRTEASTSGPSSPVAVESIRKAVTYGARLPDEVATWMLRELVRQYPETATTPEFSKWQKSQK